MIDDSITIGNFIGPMLTGLGLFTAFYFSSKTSRKGEISDAIKPLADKLLEVTTRTENFVPKSEIDVKFRGVEAHQLINDMDIKELRSDVINLRERHAKHEQQMDGAIGSINEIKDQQREIIQRLDRLISRDAR